MNVITCTQGTPEWLAARAGRVTASKITDVMAKGRTKGAEASTRRAYRAQIVAEILTGAPQADGFHSAAMAWGTEQEPYARAAYEVAAGVLVDQVGLVLHPTIERGAASPDGLVGADGLLEIKCPNTVTHLQYMEDGVAPDAYHPQMLWQMACTGRQWCDFVSFDPRLPDHLQLFRVRFPRDEARIREIEDSVRGFLLEVDAMLARLGAA